MKVERFFGKPVKVTVGGTLRQPQSFTLAQREYTVVEVLAVWADSGFGKLPLKRRRWWMRHHRTCYRVRTEEGEVYDLYYDRGTSLSNPRYRRWFLSRRVVPSRKGASGGGPTSAPDASEA